MKKVLYFGWIGFNNLGDELMWDVFKSNFILYLNNSDYHLIPSNVNIKVDDYSLYDTLVLGGGSLLLPGYIDMLYKAKKKGKDIIIWGSGYDWAERRFVKILKEGTMPHYLFDQETEDQLAGIAGSAKYFGVRGPLTYSLLNTIGIDITKVQLSGDPGFLIKPEMLTIPSPIQEWNKNEKVIAINWGTSNNNIYGRQEERLENTIADVCKGLIAEGYKLYMYIVWDKDIEPSKKLYEKINSPRNIILDTNMYTAGELATILKGCYFSINLKLHANVISAVAPIPFICLGYRFKCYDLMESLNLSNLIIATDVPNIKQEIYDAIEIIKANYSDITANLSSIATIYRERVLKPFKEKAF